MVSGGRAAAHSRGLRPLHPLVAASALWTHIAPASGQTESRPEPSQGGSDGAAATAPAPPEEPAYIFPPTNLHAELAEISPGVALKREFDEFAARTNLRLGVANTYLFQQATGGPGDRSGAGGDLDLLAKWTAIGAGTKDTGIVAFAAEYRYQIGDMAPAALGAEIGTLLPTTNGFGERPVTVKELYWDHRLLDDSFRYVLGRVDPENLFGGHRLQSANTFFLNKAFSSNPTVAYPGPGLVAAALVKPVEWLYIDGGVTDANGKATVGNFEGFFEDSEFLAFAEAGVTPEIDGLGAGRYRLSLWHIDARESADTPSDQGVSLSFDQDFGEALIGFARYGYAEGDVTGVAHSVQGGVGIKDVLGKDNMLGLAAAWSEPEANGKRAEKVLEVFQRFQITETFQFTLGAEAILDPSNAPDDEAVGVFSARLRFAF